MVATGAFEDFTTITKIQEITEKFAKWQSFSEAEPKTSNSEGRPNKSTATQIKSTNTKSIRNESPKTQDSFLTAINLLSLHYFFCFFISWTAVRQCTHLPCEWVCLRRYRVSRVVHSHSTMSIQFSIVSFWRGNSFSVYHSTSSSFNSIFSWLLFH